MSKHSGIHACSRGLGRKKAKTKSDNLSKVLAEFAVILDTSLAQKEVRLRREVIKGFELYGDSRIELGRRLFNYRTFYKPLRLWTKVTGLMGEVVGCDARTILRIVEEYEVSIGILKVRKNPLPEIGDESFQDEAFSLSEKQISYLEGRQLVRQAVNWCCGAKQIISVLTQIISEEARSTWNMEKSFTMEIHPCLPCITLLSDDEPLQEAA